MRNMRCFALVLALVCVFAVSCARADTDGETVAPNHGDIGGENVKITPAGYASGALGYTLTIGDGKRSVSLAVTRADGVTEAKVTEPAGLLGLKIVADAGGVRMTPPNGELLGLTEEASAGLRAFFEAMGHELRDSEKKAEGMYEFEVSGYEVALLLGEDGYPKLITLARDGFTRHGEIATLTLRS